MTTFMQRYLPAGSEGFNLSGKVEPFTQELYGTKKTNRPAGAERGGGGGLR